MFPFLFENSKDITVSNLKIDWDIPFTHLAEVLAVNKQEGWRDVRPFTEGFSWKYKKGAILYPNIDGFNYKYLGSTLPFDPVTKRVVVGAVDTHSNPTKIEKRKDGVFRIYEKSRYYPPVGSLLSSKGNREDDRYAPAFNFKECNSITLKGVTVHHALGMAYLFERCDGITISGCNVMLREGSPRVISSTADATHFANCKGDILIENCVIMNMLDDGTNVHGTYLTIDSIVDAHSVVARLEHFEQMGFKFADKGDEMWFILAPSPERNCVNVVKKVDVINEKYIRISFEQPLPSEINVGDILENKSWNPTFTMRGCTIKNIRARAIVLKTHLKTVIEDNYFSSMMSGVLFRGETFFWYESGAVEDVLIRNNHFHNAADCGTKHAAMYITPRLGKGFDQSATYDRNIRFEDNVIDSHNPRIVIADRVDGLVIKGNKINLNKDEQTPFPNSPMFEIEDSHNVTISDNSYTGESPYMVLQADEVSKKSLTIENNIGF